MNETLKTIAERYSCRDYEDTPLTDEQVATLVDAALAAPSAMNRQPWHITMVTDKALIDDLDRAALEVLRDREDTSTYERIRSRGGKVLYNAPAMMLVSADGSEFASMDSGILSQNVALAAHCMGLGNVICAMAGIPFKDDDTDGWKKRFGVPVGYDFAIAILLGTARSGKDPHELETDKVTYR
ncbi:MAG: nitroreductase family protein [Coriobacteriia bacterium]|nr:nitroreductase family protein [Coriobacteriia bacterium]